MISGARLRQLREARSLSQQRLAEAIGVPQPFVSQFESESRLADPVIARKIADHLGVPTSMLTRTPVTLPEGSLGLFRSARSKVTADSFYAARRMAEIGVESVWRLGEGTRLPSCRIESVPGADPKEAATYARSMLRLAPDDPVPHVTRSIERAGGIVVKLSGMAEGIDGFSAWAPDPVARPIFVLRRDTGPFRLRFTLAHELGHMILGHQVFGRPSKDTEAEANTFASCFLLPEEAMHDAFAGGIDLRSLARIKGRFGAAMGAILLRARAMGYVDELRYRSLYETMRRKGWLKKEPGDELTKVEEPAILPELMNRKGIDLNPFELAGALDIGIDQARALIGDGVDPLDLAALTV